MRINVVIGASSCRSGSSQASRRGAALRVREIPQPRRSRRRDRRSAGRAGWCPRRHDPITRADGRPRTGQDGLAGRSGTQVHRISDDQGSRQRTRPGASVRRPPPSTRPVPGPARRRATATGRGALLRARMERTGRRLRTLPDCRGDSVPPGRAGGARTRSRARRRRPPGRPRIRDRARVCCSSAGRGPNLLPVGDPRRAGRHRPGPRVAHARPPKA